MVGARRRGHNRRARHLHPRELPVAQEARRRLLGAHLTPQRRHMPATGRARPAQDRRRAPPGRDREPRHTPERTATPPATPAPESPSASRVSVTANDAPSTHTSTAPVGPSRPCPASSTAGASTCPTAPPGPAMVGQETERNRGTASSAAANTGIAAPIVTSRAAMLPSPRCEPMRQAQASIATPGNAPATPNPCSSMSDTTAPTGPARFARALRRRCV